MSQQLRNLYKTMLLKRMRSLKRTPLRVSQIKKHQTQRKTVKTLKSPSLNQKKRMETMIATLRTKKKNLKLMM